MAGQPDITLLLRRAGEGDREAMNDLMEAVYSDLARIAAAKMRARLGPEAGRVTLEPLALVHETFVKLRDADYRFENRRHYFSLAARVMLNVLIDYQRRRAAGRRRGERVELTLDGLPGGSAASPPTATAVALRAAFDKLESLNPRHAEVVRLKVMWGFKNAEVAGILGVSTPTVERDWRFARSWLAHELEAAAPA